MARILLIFVASIVMRAIECLTVQVDFAVELEAIIITTVSLSTPTPRTTSSTTHNTTTTDDIGDKFYHNTTTTSPTGARNKTDGYRNRHKDCRKEKDAHKKDAEKACDELEEAQMGVCAPLLDFELGIDMSNEETLKHLKLLDEHFCDHWKEYEDTWTGCGLHTENHTTQNAKRVDSRDDAKEALCTLKSEPEVTCKDFDKCWTEAIARFNERNATIKELQNLLEEYGAASKVNCLWDAWKWLDDPITVDEDKVKTSSTSTSSTTSTSTSSETLSPNTASSMTSTLTNTLSSTSTSYSTPTASKISSTVPKSPSTSSCTSASSMTSASRSSKTSSTSTDRHQHHAHSLWSSSSTPSSTPTSSIT